MSSVSASASESCCIPSTCSCEEWLTAFCDYEQVTVSYCGESTVFNSARSSEIPIEAVNMQSGVHPQDRVFRVSMTENDIEVGIGATITDSDGTQWTVYRVETLSAFCVKKLTARSVAACFQLLDTISILEQECDCEDCTGEIRWIRRKNVKGKLLAEGGAESTRNDSTDIVYRWRGELVSWPLSDLPSSRHRISGPQGVFRIRTVVNNGPMVPFIVGLEKDNVECSN